MEQGLAWEDFLKVDMRVGTIVRVDDFPTARKPAYQIQINFGDLGIRKSSAQLTFLYAKSDLIGKQVVCVVNFPPKQIGNFMSECLILGAMDEGGKIILLQPEQQVDPGLRIG